MGTDLSLRDTALLLGFDPQGQCVYSAQMPLEQYWEGDHPWDDDQEIRRLRLAVVKGYLFNDDGGLDQECQSTFDPDTGLFQSGWSRDEDGVVQHG